MTYLESDIGHNNVISNCYQSKFDDHKNIALINKLYQSQCLNPNWLLCGHDDDQTCYPRYRLCILETDHYGNIIFCPNHPQDCYATLCAMMYKCLDEYSVALHHVCDGTYNCIVIGVDESDCNNYTCPFYFSCRYERICLNWDHFCDQLVNCLK